LAEAVALALVHHPALHAQGARIGAREREVEVARTGYLPSLDVSIELERATGNVLRGAIFGMRGIPNVSGPPTGRALDGGASGSAAGIGASWDALGMIGRMANVDTALAAEHREEAAMASQRLAIAFLAADRFLALAARSDTVKAAKANVDRARILES